MPALTPTLCRDAMAVHIATVTGAGTMIHKHRRKFLNERDVKKLLYDPTLAKLVGWMISPAASNTTVVERNPGHAGIGTRGAGNNFVTLQWQIEGYHVLDDADASEQVFMDLAWNVAKEFNAYGVIPGFGSPPACHLQLPADVEAFGFAMLAGWGLVHYCRISIGFRGQML